jgi:hypothetical protein
MFVKQFAKQLDIETTQTYELPQDCQELKAKHVQLIHKNTVHQVAITHVCVAIWSVQ